MRNPSVEIQHSRHPRPTPAAEEAPSSAAHGAPRSEACENPERCDSAYGFPDLEARVFSLSLVPQSGDTGLGF